MLFTKFSKPCQVKNWDLVKDSFKTDLSKETKTRCIEYNSLFVGQPLVMGNKKIEKNTGIFSIFNRITCLNCKDCVCSCYANKDLRYPTVYDRRLLYTNMAYTNTSYLESLLNKQIAKASKKGMEFVRIHESGDFFSQAYVDMWTRVLKNNPSVKGYFYTKVDNVFNFQDLCKYANMVHSILPDGSINYGSKEYVIEKAKKYGFPICPFNAKDDKTKCGNCTICMYSKHVLFYQH